MAKNITLAFDEEKLAQLRVLAAERRTTINALLRRHVDDLLEGDGRRKKALADVLALVDRNIARDAEQAGSATGDAEQWRWNREDCYSGPRFDRMRGDH